MIAPTKNHVLHVFPTSPHRPVKWPNRAVGPVPSTPSPHWRWIPSNGECCSCTHGSCRGILFCAPIPSILNAQTNACTKYAIHGRSSVELLPCLFYGLFFAGLFFAFCAPFVYITGRFVGWCDFFCAMRLIVVVRFCWTLPHTDV